MIEKIDADERDDREQDEPDPDADRQAAADDQRDQHRDLEVQRLLALVVDERELVLLHQPDDQRPEERAEGP